MTDKVEANSNVFLMMNQLIHLKHFFKSSFTRWRVHSHVTLCTCDDIMPKDCLLQPRVVWWSRCKSFLFSKSDVYFFQAPIPIGLQRGKTLPFSMSGFFLQLIGLFWYHMCKSISYISTFPAHLSQSTYVTSSVVKNIDISINIDTEISERYQY